GSARPGGVGRGGAPGPGGRRWALEVRLTGLPPPRLLRRGSLDYPASGILGRPMEKRQTAVPDDKSARYWGVAYDPAIELVGRACAGGLWALDRRVVPASRAWRAPESKCPPPAPGGGHPQAPTSGLLGDG